MSDTLTPQAQEGPSRGELLRFNMNRDIQIPGDTIQAANPEFRTQNRFINADPGNALIEQLLSTPFVQDTLAQLLGGDQFVQTAPQDSHLAGFVRPDSRIHGYPRASDTIHIEGTQWPDRMARAGRRGSFPFLWHPETVFSHELGHVIDQNPRNSIMPPEVEAKIFREIYSAGERGLSEEDALLMTSDRRGNPDIPRRNPVDVEEGFAHAIEEALLFMRKKGPYEDEANRNLIALEARRPGSVTALGWLANNIKDTSGKKNDK